MVLYISYTSIEWKIQDKIPSLIILRTESFWHIAYDALFTDSMLLNAGAIAVLILAVIFIVPVFVLLSVQTQNMLENETTSERNSRLKDIKA